VTQTKVSAAYQRAFEMALRGNQLTLFNLNGTDRLLNLERHVDEYVREFRVGGLRTLESSVLQLTLDLWASWEVHIRQSAYKTQHFGAVHAEHRWFTKHEGAPPCALLSNSTLALRNERPGVCPVSYEWRAQEMLGPIRCRTFNLADVGICYRFYLGV
jgi:hypothetical protein